MKAISYLKSVPARNSNLQKTQLLTNFIKGVQRNGDTGIVHSGMDVHHCDVALIQGWVHQQVNTPHLQLRKRVIDTQLQNKKYVLVADGNLFLYADPKNTKTYLRYSFNGVFPSTGIYFDTHIDPTRWQKIKNNLNIDIEPYKTKGKHIVLCLQRNGGWSMGDYQVKDWIYKTIREIRQHSDRPIILRPHPGDKKVNTYLNPADKFYQKTNVRVSRSGTSLDVDLEKAWAVVNHNSSSIFGPCIQGYHAFVTDSEKSQCSEVAHTDFSFLENPKEFDRDKWLQRISMFHWDFNELARGEAWEHFKSYCQ